MLIYLVIVMTINGSDYERRVPMDTEALCWENAANLFKQMKDEHGDELTDLGIGCVFKKEGDPA